MAKQERYLIGPSLLSDIRRTITRVDSIAPRTSGASQPVRLQDLQRPASGLRRGTFTGVWAIGTTKAVEVAGSTQTVSVTNYCTPIVGGTTYTTSLNVVFGSVGGTVSAVEVQNEIDIRLGKTTGSWAKGTLANIVLYEEGTALNETNNGQTLGNCVNKFATVSANKWVALARGPGGRHYLIAAEC